MFLGQLIGLPRVMWIGIAAMSVIHPSDAVRKKSHMFFRFIGNVLGCVGFFILIKILPESMYGMIGDVYKRQNYGKAVKNVYEIYEQAGIEDISIKLYKDDRHELINETDKEDIYEDIRGWMVCHL